MLQRRTIFLTGIFSIAYWFFLPNHSTIIKITENINAVRPFVGSENSEDEHIDEM
jgi:hypothetical protein